MAPVRWLYPSAPPVFSRRLVPTDCQRGSPTEAALDYCGRQAARPPAAPAQLARLLLQWLRGRREAAHTHSQLSWPRGGGGPWMYSGGTSVGPHPKHRNTGPHSMTHAGAVGVSRALSLSLGPQPPTSTWNPHPD